MPNNHINAIVGLVLLSLSGQASAILIDALDSGWYDNTGFHDPMNPNYIIREAGLQQRNFFVFDLTSFSGIATAATLHIWTGTSNTGTIDYTMYDVSTSVATLVAGGGLGAFNDLGTGTQLSATNTYGPGNNDTIVNIALNASGLLDVTSGLGGAMGDRRRRFQWHCPNYGEYRPWFLRAWGAMDGQTRPHDP